MSHLRRRRGRPRIRDRPGSNSLRRRLFPVSRLSGRVIGLLSRVKGRWLIFLPLGAIAIYIYSVFVNAVKAGIGSTFSLSGTEQAKLLEWNPFKSLPALVTPVGFGVTFVSALMVLLANKKGYNLLSGYKAYKDKRGFEVLPDGTHGTSGFMRRAEMKGVLEVGAVRELTGTVLGKMKRHPDDDDRLAEYVTPKAFNGLNEHIMVFGASGAGKSRGFVKPFILQCARRRESLILVDPKGEFFESMT